MEFMIYPRDGIDLKELIVDDVKENVSETWDIKKTKKDEEVLVHTREQWKKKGFIRLKNNDDYEKDPYVLATFKYWTSFEDEDKNSNDAGYMLGRFTELLLVHFKDKIDDIIIRDVNS